MKKLFFILFVAVLSMPISAQPNSTNSVQGQNDIILQATCYMAFDSEYAMGEHMLLVPLYNQLVGGSYYSPIWASAHYELKRVKVLKAILPLLVVERHEYEDVPNEPEMAIVEWYVTPVMCQVTDSYDLSPIMILEDFISYEMTYFYSMHGITAFPAYEIYD